MVVMFNALDWQVEIHDQYQGEFQYYKKIESNWECC